MPSKYYSENMLAFLTVFSLFIKEHSVVMEIPSHQNAPNLTNVFAYVDSHRQPFLDRLIDYLRRPSISAHGEGMSEVARYIASIGLSVHF